MHSRKQLAGLFIFTFVVSFLFSLYYKIPPAADAQAYEQIGLNVARGLGYIEHAENANDKAKDDAIVRVGPGYELFLALIFKIFGHALLAVWFIQALLRACTAIGLYYLGCRLFEGEVGGRKISLAAGYLFACTPDLIVVGGMLLMETFLLFLMVFATYVSVLSLRNPEVSKFFMAGSLWGLAALVRPTMLVPLVLYGCYIFWEKRHISISTLFVIGIVPLLVVGGWSLRNSLLYHRVLFTTTAGPYALWVGNYEGATGGWYKTPEIQKVRDTHHSVELADIAKQKYREFLVEHPLQFIELQFKKTIQYFTLLRPTGFWFYLNGRPYDKFITLVASGAGTAFLFILGAAGAYAYARSVREKVVTYFLISVMIVQPLVVIPTYVETRYRYPLYPFLALFVAYVAWKLLQKDRVILKISLVSFMVFIAITGIDLLYAWELVRDRANMLLREL